MKLWNEEGQIIVYIACLMSIFIGILAFVIDGGYLYLEKANVQKASDSAALAGAQEIPTSQTHAIQKVREAIELNKENPSNYSILFNSNLTKIEVVGKKKVKLFFAGALGIQNPEVEARATVELAPITSGFGAVPLGFDYRSLLIQGMIYILSVEDSGIGKFNALAFSGGGADRFEKDLTIGFNGSLKVNDIVDIESGSMNGPTNKAISTRISACPNDSYTNYSSGCSRLVLVPIVKPYSYEKLKLKQVMIVGFATFFIEGVTPTWLGSNIIGRFVQATYPGNISTNQTDYGTFGYKLTR
ncbi:Tad domain-containing protein [Bacillus massilinigeriensis]|uniref:Tad domain-containing protein n=1 Tax=Bacillus massilionigeriensis TaxID=1805475 RepID=UPI00096B26A7|nr:Tad domain-containing protein [Bacillus massilionigeriensis]